MSQEIIILLLKALWETTYMVTIASVLATLVGLPIGVMLATTRKGGILEKPSFYNVLAFIVNAARSVPFIVLLLAITPLTRLIVGTSIGTNAATVPLIVAAIPFVARIIENALHEVPAGLIEAGLVMGATPLQIVYKILLPEALPSITEGITIVIIALIGYSAMAGTVGGGGLGNVAYNYGYERFDIKIMLITVVILIFQVQIIQWIGDKITKRLRHSK